MTKYKGSSKNVSQIVLGWKLYAVCDLPIDLTFFIFIFMKKL